MAEYSAQNRTSPDACPPESGSPQRRQDFPPVMLIVLSDDDLAEAKKCARMLRTNGVSAEIVQSGDAVTTLKSAWDGDWLLILLFEPESDEDERRDELHTGLQWCENAWIFRRMADGSTCVYGLFDAGGEPAFVRWTETPEDVALLAAYIAMDARNAAGNGISRGQSIVGSRSAQKKRNVRKTVREAVAVIIAVLTGFLVFTGLNDCMGEMAEQTELPEISADVFESLTPPSTLDLDALEKYAASVSGSDAVG